MFFLNTCYFSGADDYKKGCLILSYTVETTFLSQLTKTFMLLLIPIESISQI